LLYLEIKSAVLRGNKVYAMYPDCPSVRGRRHIREIIDYVKRGGLGGLLFIVALPYATAFRSHSEGDPEISKLLKEAYQIRVLIFDKSN